MCKKHFRMVLRVIFRIYILGFYLECYPAYSIKGWEAVSLNFRSLESSHCYRRCCCRCRCCRSCNHRRFSTTVARHRRWSPTIAHHRRCRWSPTITRYRNHCHTKSLMGALDSYDVSNFKFKYFKSNYALP